MFLLGNGEARRKGSEPFGETIRKNENVVWRFVFENEADAVVSGGGQGGFTWAARREGRLGDRFSWQHDGQRVVVATAAADASHHRRQHLDTACTQLHGCAPLVGQPDLRRVFNKSDSGDHGGALPLNKRRVEWPL